MLPDSAAQPVSLIRIKEKIRGTTDAEVNGP
jgi:hypothetical protein